MNDGMDLKQAVLSGIMLSGKKVTDDVVKVLDRDAKFTKPTQIGDQSMTKFAQNNYGVNERDEELFDLLPVGYGSNTSIFDIQNYSIPNEWDELKPIIQEISENRMPIPKNQLPLPGFIPKKPITFDDYLDSYDAFAEALVNKYGPNPTIANFRREIMDDNMLAVDADIQISPMSEYYRAQQARRYALKQLGLYDPVEI